MGGTHSVDTDTCEHLESCVSMAHDGLADVVEAVITMLGYFSNWHSGDALRIVCKAEEVLRNGISSLVSSVYTGDLNLQDSGAGETSRLHRRPSPGHWEKGAREEDLR